MIPERLRLQRDFLAAHSGIGLVSGRVRHGGDASAQAGYAARVEWMEAGVRFGKVDAELLVWNDPPARLSRVESRYRPDAFYRIKCEYLARWLKSRLAPPRELWLWGAGRREGKDYLMVA